MFIRLTKCTNVTDRRRTAKGRAWWSGKNWFDYTCRAPGLCVALPSHHCRAMTYLPPYERLLGHCCASAFIWSRSWPGRLGCLRQAGRRGQRTTVCYHNGRSCVFVCCMAINCCLLVEARSIRTLFSAADFGHNSTTTVNSYRLACCCNIMCWSLSCNNMLCR